MSEQAKKGDFGILDGALVRVVGFTRTGKARIRKWKRSRNRYGPIVTSDAIPNRATLQDLNRYLGWTVTDTAE